MFSSKPDEMLSADNKPAVPRVTAGAVKSLKDTFSGVERDYQDLRDRLTSGLVAIEIDPVLIDPSPFADRFAEAARKLRVGNGLDPQTEMGPLANERRIPALEALVEWTAALPD